MSEGTGTKGMTSVSAKTTPRRFRWLEGWSRIFLEMLAITFGVLLAFSLNEWRTARAQSDRVERSVENIRAELDRNHASLERAYEYRMEVYPKILEVMNEDAKFWEIGFRGTQPPRFERAAYDVAVNTGVLSELDTELAEKLIGAYLFFDRIEGTHRTYSAGLPMIIFEADGQDDPRMAIFMQMAFQDFIYAETEALNYLAEMSGKTPKPPPWETISEMLSAAREREGSR